MKLSVRTAAVLGVLAVVLAACGSNGGTLPSDGGSSPTGSPSPAGTASPGTTNSKNGKGTSKGKVVPGSTQLTPRPRLSFPDHVKGTKKAPLEVDMKSCVTPGGIQKITIQSKPRLQISFATLYPDQKTHQEWGGQEVFEMPATGTFTKTWAIPPGAEKGESRTDVAAGGYIDENGNGENEDDELYTAFDQVYWNIKSSC